MKKYALCSLVLVAIVLLTAQTTSLKWTDIRSSQRHGTGANGQSSDGTGATNALPKYNANGTVIGTGVTVDSSNNVTTTGAYNSGSGSGTTGALDLVGGTSGNTVTLTVGTSTAAGTLTLSGNTGTVAYSTSAGTSGNCVKYDTNGFGLLDAGAACGSGGGGSNLTYYPPFGWGGSNNLTSYGSGGANNVLVWPFWISSSITVGHVQWYIGRALSAGGGVSLAIYSTAGALLMHTTPYTTTGVSNTALNNAVSGGSFSLTAGVYYWAWTSSEANGGVSVGLAADSGNAAIFQQLALAGLAGFVPGIGANLSTGSGGSIAFPATLGTITNGAFQAIPVTSFSN